MELENDKSFRSIKISNKLYQELNEIRQTTDIPISKIIELAFIEFKNTKAGISLSAYIKSKK